MSACKLISGKAFETRDYCPLSYTKYSLLKSNVSSFSAVPRGSDENGKYQTFRVLSGGVCDRPTKGY